MFKRVGSFTRQFTDDLLERIIVHTIPKWDDFSSSESPTATLASLCLTSKLMYRLTREVLYQDIVLCGRADGLALVASIEDHQTDVLIARTTKTVSLGPRSGRGIRDGAWTDEVLAGLPVPNLEVVEFRYVDLGVGPLETLRVLRRLDLFQVTIESGVHLDLPVLTSLDLQWVTLTDKAGNAHQLAFTPAGLPSLNKLTIAGSKSDVSPATLLDRHATLAALAPQLAELALEEHAASTWINFSDENIWRSLTSLRRLALAKPAGNDCDTGTATAAALRHLPRPLEGLDIRLHGRNKDTFTVTAFDVNKAFSDDAPGISALKVLALPPVAAFGPPKSARIWALLAVRDKLVAVAEARGVRVVER